MLESRIVLIKIAAMFMVIVVGWVARHRGYLQEAFTATLSRLVVDVAFPALVFTQMVRTVDAGALRQGWLATLLCGFVIGIAYLVGSAVAPLFSSPGQRRTFVFLAATPNWVFLPLPIAEALYGDAGVQIVLLANVGAQLTLWTFGVWILHGTLRQAAQNLLGNIGLWATVAGVALALAWPDSRYLETINPAKANPAGLAGGAVIQALAMVGSLTVPLSLFAIGAQLGGLIVPVHRFPRPLWGVLLARLILAPLVTILIGCALVHAGVPLSKTTLLIGYLIAAMPAAISCSVLVERFGGDVPLAAQGIFYSTFASLITVPVIFYLAQRWGF